MEKVLNFIFYFLCNFKNFNVYLITMINDIIPDSPKKLINQEKVKFIEDQKNLRLTNNSKNTFNDAYLRYLYLTADLNGSKYDQMYTDENILKFCKQFGLTNYDMQLLSMYISYNYKIKKFGTEL